MTTKKVFDEIDLKATYANVITSTVLPLGSIPMMFDNDQQAIAVALKTCNEVEPNEAKIVRIKNTAQLDEIEISETLFEEATKNASITIESKSYPIRFTENGDLI